MQNRGRLTAPRLAQELEVTPRTILRDVDDMTEGGLHIITYRGPQGGIELGFNHRTRLTGLAADEAEALAIWRAAPPPQIATLGLTEAAARAKAKLIKSFPDGGRILLAETFARFPRVQPQPLEDPRVTVIAQAIREGLTLRCQAWSSTPALLRPTTASHDAKGCAVFDPPLDKPLARADWGDINLARTPLP